MATITVSKEYGCVLITAIETFLLAFWHGNHVAAFRNTSDIGYPNAYVTSEQIPNAPLEDERLAMYVFNCAQHAYYNFLEN